MFEVNAGIDNDGGFSGIDMVFGSFWNILPRNFLRIVLEPASLLDASLPSFLSDMLTVSTTILMRRIRCSFHHVPACRV